MVQIADLSIVFMSYDEPRRDEFWADLKAKCPRAQRSHGVKGLDRCFKAAIARGLTSHVITVDADNVVDAAFFASTLDDALLQPSTRIDWPARNAVNGVVSGNGGMKCWPKAMAAVMRTHEAAPPEERSVDFPVSPEIVASGAPHRVEQPLPMSTLFCNGSPQQALRSGFREAVRLSIPPERGGRPQAGALGEQLHPMQRHRLALWCSIGADVQNGLWCIYGARLALRMMHLEGFDILAINDYDWFDRQWRAEVGPRFAGRGERCRYTGYGWDPARLQAAVEVLGAPLRQDLGLDVLELDAERSRFFKKLYRAPPSFARIDSLGTMFRRGIGVAQDLDRAAFCHRIAAEAGYPNALNSLARICRTGEGVPRDLSRAVALLREATALGNAYAPHQLGRLYRDGQGVERDPVRARELFMLAGERGFVAAHHDVAELYEGGEGVARDPERALHHYALAAAAVPGLEEKMDALRRELGAAG